MTFSDTQVKKLSDKLDSAHVRTRRNRGVELVYIEGWHSISEANRIFGYDAWDRQTLSAKCVWTGKGDDGFAATYTAKVRIRVRAGSITIIREGCGTGEGTGTTSGESHDIALKAAETDATKRALATFGNPFGLALYDRSLAGVRRPGRIQRTSDDGNNIGWVLRSADGQNSRELATPAAFAEALKAAIEEADDTEMLFQVWEQNSRTVRALHKLPDSQQVPISAKDLSLLFKERAIRLAREQSNARPPEQASESQADISADEETNGHRIDKSLLKLGAPKRWRSKEHLEFVASQSCLICGRRPTQAHHVRYAQPSALGRKVSDEYVVPLCASHHQALHRAGNEKSWWMGHAIDPLPTAERLWNEGPRNSTVHPNQPASPATPPKSKQTTIG